MPYPFSLISTTNTPEQREGPLWNFIALSLFFSLNHGSAASCLALAIPRLGDVGAIQSGILYFVYTASSLLGATYVTKAFGARNALSLGMSLYCVYIGCFLLATLYETIRFGAAIFGAILGGIGGGFLWTAQGSYFSSSSELYASSCEIPTPSATSFLGGIFAFIYLSTEVILKSISTTLIENHFVWTTVFGIYLVVAIIATCLMVFIYDFRKHEEGMEEVINTTVLYKISAGIRLFYKDPKMKCMFGLNAAFGFASSFLASYVSGKFEAEALHDDDSKFIGLLSATTAGTAALFSAIFGYISQKPNIGKSPILIVGASFFFLVGFSIVLFPNPIQWGWFSMFCIYIFQGIGRATFEGTLRAEFADMFPLEKEGAFANIILQNGLSSTLGYFLSPIISPLVYAWIVVSISTLAIIGYLRAKKIQEREMQQDGAEPFLYNDDPI